MLGKVRNYQKSEVPSKGNVGTQRWKWLAIGILILVVLITIVYIVEVRQNNQKITSASLKNGCLTVSDKNATVMKTAAPAPISGPSAQTAISQNSGVPVEDLVGQLNVSIGDYSATLPVRIDGLIMGNTSRESPLILNISEGLHQVQVCSGSACERVNVHIGYAIKTSVDFQKFLENETPQGSLSVSIGEYPATIPVSVDGSDIGMVSQGKPLVRTMTAGNHTVKICLDGTCINNVTEITPSGQTFLDFEEQLEHNLPQGLLRISIGGYEGELPVFIENTIVGNVSKNKPLDLMVNEGNHTVEVCAGVLCQKQNVLVKFGKQSYADFGDQLLKHVDFSSPTIIIKGSSLNGNVLTVDVQYINPDNKDHTFTASVSCVYSFSNYQSLRMSDSAQILISRYVTAGERPTQQYAMYLPGGSNIAVNTPVIIDLKVT